MNGENFNNWDKIYIRRDGIEQQIKDTKESCFIFGARRIGKTALLQFLETQFWEEAVPAFYLSIEGFTSSEKIKKKIENRFKSRSYEIPDLDFNQSTFFEFIDDLDIKLGHQSLVFLIDEVEQIIKIQENEDSFIAEFRNCITSVKNIRFILTASPRFKKVIPKSISSAFLSAFQPFILEVMNHEEITQLIRCLVAEQIENHVVDQILKYTHHQPFLVKRFLGNLIKNGILHEPCEETAKNTYVHNFLDSILEDYFEGLSDKGKRIVRQIHENKFKLNKKFEVDLIELTQYGYIKKDENGKYKISNWFFEQWLTGENLATQVEHQKTTIAEDLADENLDAKDTKKFSIFSRIKNLFKGKGTDFFIKLVIAFAVAGSSPWWIKQIPWQKIPFTIDWKDGSEVAFLPGDLEIDLKLSKHRSLVTIKVECISGNITLSRKGKIIDQKIDQGIFNSKDFSAEIKLISIAPNNLILNNENSGSTINVEFDMTQLIPTSEFLKGFTDGKKQEVGMIKFRYYYDDRNKVTVEKDIDIPIFVIK